MPLQIERYRVLGELGEGSQGKVYLAHDPKLDRQVAIKVVHPALAHDELAMARFHREARAIASLHHTNILEIYDYSGSNSALGFLVVERLHGTNLDQLVNEQGPLDASAAAALTHEICLALEHAHERGLVHRDLKPENVFLEPDGRVVLCDFGVARSFAKNAARTLPGKESEAAGTPLFMSPEQILTPDEIGPASDLFALGSVIYFLLTGRYAFEGATVQDILEKVILAEHTPLDPAQPLSALVEQCLQAKPEARPASARAVAELLRTRAADPRLTVATLASAMSVATKELRPVDEQGEAWQAIARVTAQSAGPEQPIDFGRYKLLRRLAQGGMAELFVAEMQGLEGFSKTVALKRMLPHLAREPQFVEMFVNEAKLAATLTHPNVVQVQDLGRIDDSFYIAMELVLGADVSRIMKTLQRLGEPVPVGAAITIVLRALKGLHYAHQRVGANGQPLRLVHRDISPHNILVSIDGEVKITDFGIAKATSSQHRTSTGVLKGKYSYMSPEQASGQPLDHRSDLFAVGIVLYELLTGARPYRGDDELAVLDQARRCEIAPITTVPPPLAAFLQKALAKSPHDRFKDGAEMAAALRATETPFWEDEALAALVVRVRANMVEERDVAEARTTPLSAKSASVPVPVVTPAPPPRRAGVIVFAALALVATSLAGSWIISRASRPEPPPVQIVTREIPASVPASLPVVKVEPPPAVVVAAGWLTINSDPWSKLIVDGKDTGRTTPVKRFRLTAGRHKVRLESPPAQASREIVVDIEAGKNLTRIVSFEGP